MPKRDPAANRGQEWKGQEVAEALLGSFCAQGFQFDPTGEGEPVKVCHLGVSSMKIDLVPVCRLDCQGRGGKTGKFYILYTYTYTYNHRAFLLQNI